MSLPEATSTATFSAPETDLAALYEIVADEDAYEIVESFLKR